ncbi:MAG: hypothetical protein DRQ49_18890 [Gammaproteobacteria bacterium]|nr:MAG: hypothetical protein DRQ49_18890 [Gammaproteobacteria bacterium]
MAPRLTAQDKQWQREADARTLANADEIKNSPARLKGAVKEAKIMAKQSEKEAQSMKRVATGKIVTRSNTKLPIHKKRK